MMETGDNAVTANSIADIQAYLSNFQKDIQGPQTVSINGQHFIIQPAPVQPAQNDMESQDMKQSVNATLEGVENNDSDTAALLSATSQMLDSSLEEQSKPILPIGHAPEALMDTDNAINNTLQNMMQDNNTSTATSIPQAEAMSLQQMAPVQASTTDQSQLMALTPQMITGTSLLSNGEQGTVEANSAVLASVSNGQAEAANAVANAGALPTGAEGTNYQTVTIVPSGDVNQSGEMSYVLIVSQGDVNADGTKNEDASQIPSTDLSVYDFKEDKGGALSGCELDEDELMELAEAAAKRNLPGAKGLIKSLPRKISQMSSGASLMCNYCNYTSNKRYLLTRHMKIHSEERPHKCNICDRGFKTVASLQNHINTHTGVRPHKCKECDSCFTTSGELIRHVRYKHTFEKPHKCPECDYASVELSKLKRHIRSHTGERPYQCPQCTYASPDTYKLKRHLRVHTGEKPYQCEVCMARFTQSNTLNSHKMIHSGTKPVFQCELCPTTCGRKTDLKIHVQKLHTSDKPLICKKCGKAFPDRYTYKIHIKTHDGEKCFKCELCQYAALSQRHLENHILVHTGQKPYQCTECDQTFRQKQLLKRHMNLYHTPDYVPPTPRERQHECGDCHKTFAHRGNLLKHMELHDPDNADNEQFKQQLEAQIELDEQKIASGQKVVLQDGRTANLVQINEHVEATVPDEHEGTVLQLVSYPGSDQTSEILVQVNHDNSTLINDPNNTMQPMSIMQPTGIVVENTEPTVMMVPVGPTHTTSLEHTPMVTSIATLPLATSIATPITTHMTTTVVTPVKRGRGRPPKVEPTTLTAAVEHEDEPEKRGRGRPRGSTKKSPEDNVTIKIEDDKSQKQRDIEQCFGFDEED